MNAPALFERVRCYWVQPGRFLAGEYPAGVDRPGASGRLDAILDAGIDSFFDLTEPEELEPYASLLRGRAAPGGLAVEHRRFPIPDRGLPDEDAMRRLLDALDAALADGHHVYVHCQGGLGRTGMVVGCYLVRHGHSGAGALDRIALLRRSLPRALSPETSHQVAFVRNWSETRSERP